MPTSHGQAIAPPSPATTPTVGIAPPAVPASPTGGTAAAPMADTPAQGMTPSGPPRGVAGIAWGSPAKSVAGLVAQLLPNLL